MSVIYLPENLRAPRFDYDFSDLDDAKDGRTFRRGALPYKRPCGWYRIALNVDRFGDDKAWLGPLNRKDNMAKISGEWPGRLKITFMLKINFISSDSLILYISVSYHGTGQNNSRSIAEEGFALSKGQRFKFGYGIYSTPDIDVAELFSSEFEYKGSTYKVILLFSL
jgi:hypothetical protein